jgi:hypothetical protein
MYNKPQIGLVPWNSCVDQLTMQILVQLFQKGSHVWGQHWVIRVKNQCSLTDPRQLSSCVIAQITAQLLHQ